MSSIWNLILGNNGRGGGSSGESGAQGPAEWVTQTPESLEATLQGFRKILDGETAPKEHFSDESMCTSPTATPPSMASGSTASTSCSSTTSKSGNGAISSSSSSGSLPSESPKSLRMHNHPFTQLSVLLQVSGNGMENSEEIPLGANVPVVRIFDLPRKVSEQAILAFFAAHDVADRIAEMHPMNVALFIEGGETQAIVWMKTREDADVAQKALHHQQVDNHCVEVFAYGCDDDAMGVDAVEPVLVPGAKFKGHIFIPGSRLQDEYTLEVLSTNPVLSHLGMIVSHAAYGDEQVCVLCVNEIDGKKGHFKINFSDAETFCEGEFSLHSLELKGSVSQVKDEPGFWFPKKEETHRFELKLESEGRICRAQRASGHCTAREILKKVVWVLNIEQERTNGKTNGHSEDIVSKVSRCWDWLKQAAVDWKCLWEEAVLQSEEAACKIRMHTEWLSKLRFETEEQKQEVLGSLEGPCTRAGCHQCIDEALERVQVVLGFCIRSIKERARMSERQDDRQDIFEACESYMQKSEIQRQRLYTCYAAFDGAFRSAEARPPKDYYKKKKKKAGEEFICSICQVDVQADEEVLGLDCGHNFHVICAEEWINQHAACPNCRRCVSESSGASGSHQSVSEQIPI